MVTNTWLPLSAAAPLHAAATAMMLCLRAEHVKHRPGGNAEVCQAAGLGSLAALADGDTDPDLVMRRGLHQVRARAEAAVRECTRTGVYSGTVMSGVEQRMDRVVAL